MQGRIDLSIGKKYKEPFDEIIAYAGINNISVSKAVGEAVNEYMLKLNNKPPLVLPERMWKLNEMSKEDLLNLESQLSKMHTKVMKNIRNS